MHGPKTTHGRAAAFQAASEARRGPIDGVEWLVWAGVCFCFLATGQSRAIPVGGRTGWASAGGSWGWVWVVWPLPLGLSDPPGGVIPLPRSVRMHQRDCGTGHGSYIVRAGLPRPAVRPLWAVAWSPRLIWTQGGPTGGAGTLE